VGGPKRGRGEGETVRVVDFVFLFQKCEIVVGLCLFPYEISRAPKLLRIFCEAFL
jgi:hypothetical protein